MCDQSSRDTLNVNTYPVVWSWHRKYQHAHAMFERCSKIYPGIAELWLEEILRLDRLAPEKTVDSFSQSAITTEHNTRPHNENQQ